MKTIQSNVINKKNSNENDEYLQYLQQENNNLKDIEQALLEAVSFFFSFLFLSLSLSLS